MPRTPTFPLLFDEVKQISITKLKEFGYLKTKEIRRGVLQWGKNGEWHSEIAILINTSVGDPYMELSYSVDGHARNYRVYFVRIPSNLGRGELWYFLCPYTNKRCRILYDINGYFKHRDASTTGMYSIQAASKSYRYYEQNYGLYFKLREMYQELDQKNFKKFYAGKPTKRYLSLNNRIERAEEMASSDFISMVG